MNFIRTKRPGPAIDMAPLIDVVFLLLIFFMLTSSFREPSLPLELPSVAAESETPEEPVTVSLDAQGVIAIDGTVVARDEYEAKIAATLQDREVKAVNFRGDENLPYQEFLDLMAVTRRAGAAQFHLVHEPAP